MEEIKRLVYEILIKGYVMSLATLDEGGVWVCDVVYVFDKHFNIYWISQISTRHSRAIEKNNQVSATITTSTHGGKNEGIQIEGKAERVGRPDLEMISQHLRKRFGDIPHTKHLDENNKLTEPPLSWYRLKPTKIELFYEKYFGFDKQVIKLN